MKMPIEKFNWQMCDKIDYFFSDSESCFNSFSISFNLHRMFSLSSAERFVLFDIDIITKGINASHIKTKNIATKMRIVNPIVSIIKSPPRVL